MYPRPKMTLLERAKQFAPFELENGNRLDRGSAPTGLRPGPRRGAPPLHPGRDSVPAPCKGSALDPAGDLSPAPQGYGIIIYYRGA